MRLPKTIIPAAILLTLAVPAVHAEKSAKKTAGSQAKKPQAAQKAPAAQKPQAAQQAAPAAQQAPVRQPTAADAFAAMDTDHDGKISRAEWKGNAIGFAMLDRNGDSALSRDEFKAAGYTPAGTREKKPKAGLKTGSSPLSR
jgi:EF hand domain-containing protein